MPHQFRRTIVSFAALVSAMAIVGCGGKRLPPDIVLEVPGKELFVHHVVDHRPPGGAACCTDVVSLGDINGDGSQDIVLGGEGAIGAGLVWYEYPSWERHEIARGEFTTDGRVVDFDGDGDQDVVIGDTSAGITWFEQLPAEGRRWAWPPNWQIGSRRVESLGFRMRLWRTGQGWKRHVLVPDYAHDIRVADVDANGRNDVVFADKQKLELLQFDVTGVLHRKTVLVRAGEGLDVADVDGDGDLDILYSNVWMERGDSSEEWVLHEIAPTWPADTRVAAIDVNGDDRLDAVLSASEGDGRLAWFERPADDRLSEGWTEHLIGAETLTGAHSLRVGDFDLDGDVDVLVAEMHTSPHKRIILYLSDAGSWRSVLLAKHGSHNMAAGDLDGDGDVDIVGKNYAGRGRFLEFWENRGGGE